MAVQTSAHRGAVARVYRGVKERILCGELRLRQRLDVDHLARSHQVSTTPVRQALALLAFERLVVSHPTRGYYVALWSEQALRDLYEWRGMLAYSAAATFAPTLSTTKLSGPSAYADAVAYLLQHLNSSGNTELVRAATNTDERLSAARRVEPDILSGCEEELGALKDAILHGKAEKIQAVLREYHARRAARAGEIRGRAILSALPDDGE